MSHRPRLLCLAGSAREGSVNKKLARLAAEIAGEHGAEAAFVDLADYPMPLYDGDLEATEGLPETARALKGMLLESDGLFIASPEYNGSFPALLKNTLDWISRRETREEVPLGAYRGKVAALSAASPGGFGGLRGLIPLRMLLGNLGVHVLPDQLAVPDAFEAFDADDRLHDRRRMRAFENVIASLIHTTARLAA